MIFGKDIVIKFSGGMMSDEDIGKLKMFIDRKSVERSKISVMLYNFVGGEVPENLKDLLKNGMDSVPESRITKKRD